MGRSLGAAGGSGWLQSGEFLDGQVFDFAHGIVGGYAQRAAEFDVAEAHGDFFPFRIGVEDLFVVDESGQAVFAHLKAKAIPLARFELDPVGGFIFVGGLVLEARDAHAFAAPSAEDPGGRSVLVADWEREGGEKVLSFDPAGFEAHFIIFDGQGLLADEGDAGGGFAGIEAQYALGQGDFAMVLHFVDHAPVGFEVGSGKQSERWLVGAE